MPLSKKEIASMEANDACMTCLEKIDKRKKISSYKLLTPKRKFIMVKGKSKASAYDISNYGCYKKCTKKPSNKKGGSKKKAKKSASKKKTVSKRKVRKTVSKRKVRKSVSKRKVKK